MRLSVMCAVMAVPSLAWAEAPKVVVDLPPVQALVAQVMAGVGAPSLILDQGGNAHSAALRPSQARALQEADLVVWVGPEMTPWLERSLSSLAEGAEVRGLLASDGTWRRTYGAEAGHEDHGHDHADHDHDHDHEGHEHEAHHHEGHDHEGHEHHGHEHVEGHDHAGHDHEAHDHAGHDHSGTDPHAWLDPRNAQHWLGVIAADLARIDPANAAIYAANAAQAQQRIAGLEADLTAQLAPLQGKSFVLGHDAYGYFTDHFGLSVAGTLALGDNAAAGAAHLSRLRATLAGGDIHCAFPEVGQDPKQLALVSEGQGVRIGAALDPEGVSLAAGPQLYDDLMRGLAKNLTDCLAAE